MGRELYEPAGSTLTSSDGLQVTSPSRMIPGLSGRRTARRTAMAPLTATSIRPLDLRSSVYSALTARGYTSPLLATERQT